VNISRYLDVQDVVLIVVAAFAFVSIRADERFAAGIAIGAVAVLLVVSILRIRVIGS
jgi:hypothetical protein